MLYYLSPIKNVKSYHIFSFFKISVSINDDLVSNILLFKSLVGILNHFNEELSVRSLALVDKIISNIILKKLKGKSSAIESKERWSSCHLSIEEICIKQNIICGIPFYKDNCSSSGKRWFIILLYYSFSGN